MKLSQARQNLFDAIQRAGVEVQQTLVSGDALEFRAEIWRLADQLRALSEENDTAVAKAMEICGAAWWKHSVTLPEGSRERRAAERAANTVGFDECLPRGKRKQ